MWANRHGAGRKAVRERARPPQKKTSLHAKRRGPNRRNHQRQRHFLRHSALSVFLTIAQVVREAPIPYRTRPYGTPGRPPADPRDIARFLLLKTLQGWSFDETYAMLEALPSLAEILGFRKVPAASTVAALVDRVPISWLEGVLQQTVRRLTQGQRVNVAGDSTGEATHQFDRWFNVRAGKASLRTRFLKLHAFICTRADRPYFLSAKVTAGTWGDAPQVPDLLDQLDPEVELGNVALDAGYTSRQNATVIEARGGLPVFALKVHVTAKTLGHPAWTRLVLRQWRDRRAHRMRYNRRAVIEGMFGALKERFGSRVRARRRHAQRVEILLRVVLWNILAIVYHRV